MIVNPELGAYRSHYTRFGHAQALFFVCLMPCLGYKSTPPNFYRLFYPKFLDLYASIYVTSWPLLTYYMLKRPCFRYRPCLRRSINRRVIIIIIIIIIDRFQPIFFSQKLWCRYLNCHNYECGWSSICLG